MLRTGRRHRTPRLDVLWRPNSLGHPRFGLVVPRFGHTAVSRNRLRRRLREIARRSILPCLEPLDFLVRSRRAAYMANYKDLATDLDQWVQTLST